MEIKLEVNITPQVITRLNAASQINGGYVMLIDRAVTNDLIDFAWNDGVKYIVLNQKWEDFKKEKNG